VTSALILLFILTTAVAAYCSAREHNYRIAEEKEGDYLNEQLQRHKEQLAKSSLARRDMGYELGQARTELVQRLRALSDCQRERDEWQQEAQTQAELYRERTKERDAAKSQVDNVQGELRSALLELSSADRACDEARTAAKAFRRVVHFSLRQGWVARDAEVAMAELTEQYPWVRNEEPVEAVVDL
jgi:hypothetical protein